MKRHFLHKIKNLVARLFFAGSDSPAAKTNHPPAPGTNKNPDNYRIIYHSKRSNRGGTKRPGNENLN